VFDAQLHRDHHGAAGSGETHEVSAAGDQRENDGEHDRCDLHGELQAAEPAI
jgi:hypothetical protein